MVRMIVSDPFPYFYLLLVGLFFVAAKCTGRNGRSPPCVAMQDVHRQPAGLSRFEPRVPVPLTEPNSGRTRIGGFDTSRLEVYARQFEEAIENIRLKSMGFWRGEDG
jgi:hypothetical protein